MQSRYAVLFKAHVWGDFEERQYERLAQCCAGADLFVFKDQTKSFHPVPLKYRTMHASEGQCLALGLLWDPSGNLFWYSNDYPTYYFYDEYGAYDYYAVCEYDVAGRFDLSGIIGKMKAESIDCIAQPVSSEMAGWHWTASGEGVYPPGQPRHGALLCLSIFSRAAVEYLFQRRRDLTEMYRAGRISTWPFGELFVPTELAQGGFNLQPLSSVLDTTCYDWWPPSTEPEAAEMPAGSIMHPVLEGARYIASCLRFTDDLGDYLDPASQLRTKLDRCAEADVLPMLFSEVRKRKDATLIGRLQQSALAPAWERFNAPSNVALSKPSTQSSTSPWSRSPTPRLDAAGGNDGVLNGSYGFHTAEEERPWWMVDLEVPHSITQIRIHNRLDVRHRARNLSVLVSVDGLAWTVCAERDAPEDFGGADGQPYVVTPAHPLAARFVRVQVNATSMLHLDEIEVIGTPP